MAVFAAFMSYSHQGDARLAPALQAGLHRFAKPWYRIRAMRVFRDTTNLAATPQLWPEIEKALLTSEYFVLLASPSAAQSHWVRREVESWCGNKTIDKLLLVLTAGEIRWDRNRADFDWSATTALPGNLAGRFKVEPLWVDLRDARSDEDLSLKNPRFAEAVAALAAAVRGISKDEIIGEDVRQQRRTRRLAIGSVTALLLATVAAIFSSVQFWQQRQIATRSAELADSRYRQSFEIVQKLLAIFDRHREGGASDQRTILTARNFVSETYGGLIAGNVDDEAELRPKFLHFIAAGDEERNDGDLVLAEIEYRNALETARKLMRRDANNAWYKYYASVSSLKLGSLLQTSGGPEEARRLYEAGLSLARESAAATREPQPPKSEVDQLIRTITANLALITE